MSFERAELSSHEVPRASWRYPDMAFRVSLRIYVHAARLFAKGVAYVPHPSKVRDVANVRGSKDTIAPGTFLPSRRQRFAPLARRIFLRLVKAKKVEGAGTLVLTRTGPRANPDHRIGDLRAQMTVHDRDAYAQLSWRFARHGRSYVNGLWDTEDMSAVVRYLFASPSPVGRARTSAPGAEGRSAGSRRVGRVRS